MSEDKLYACYMRHNTFYVKGKAIAELLLDLNVIDNYCESDCEYCTEDNVKAILYHHFYVIWLCNHDSEEKLDKVLPDWLNHKCKGLLNFDEYKKL